MKRFSSYFLGLLLAFIFAAPSTAKAFCVVNNSAAKVHVIALDASGYETDIGPSGKACCKPQQCKESKHSKATSVLVVTRYVPVAKENRPGWLAECKASLKGSNTLVVKGNHKKLSCSIK